MSDEFLDWTRLQDTAELDPGTLKRALDLVAVCEELGVVMEEGEDGKWHGICPFHDDHRPSFDVYVKDNGDQACGCFACDFGPNNDVFDLLKQLRNYGFRQAMIEAQGLLYATRGATPRLARPEKREVDLAPFVDGSRARIVDDQVALQAFLSDRGLVVPAPWLVEEFRLGVTPDGAGVVVPHYATGETLLGAKVRRTSDNGDRPWRPVALGGTKLSSLYGVWRDTGCRQVVLVEGESDTWTSAWLTRGMGVDVFGLPSGSAARPKREWLDFLGPRDVTLMFDADSSGRTALKNWTQALGVCKVVQLDEGQDASSERPERVVHALTSAVEVGTAPTAGLVPAPFGGYVRAGDDRQVMVSNFTLRLARTIELDSGYLFEVLLPDETQVMIKTSELENDGKLRKWANAHGYVFNGGIKEAQELLRLLRLDGLYHPLVRGTSVAGWHDGCFVFPAPHGVVGGRSRAYVEPIADVQMSTLLDLVPAPWSPVAVKALMHLHRPDVLTPLLGWVAAAPLRALVTAFPIFAVVGGSGWGKTTLVREVLATFGFRLGTTLTATTPHGIASFIASTNAVPVWVDEYRAGARTDTRDAFEQLLRDAWESSPSWKGGLGDQRQALTRLDARAPIVVTGEDAFTETSHLERMVIVHLPKDGRDAAALAALCSVERRGLGRAYLEWLVDRVRVGSIPAPPEVRDRPLHGRAVVAWGYAILEQFVHEVVGDELPPYDPSLVEKSHASTPPAILEVLRACEGRVGRAGPVAWRDEHDFCLRLYELVREARDLGLKLPGNARAVRNELEATYTTTEERDAWGWLLRLKDAARDVDA